MNVRVCAQCRHYRRREPVRPFAPGEIITPGVLKEQSTWEQYLQVLRSQLGLVQGVAQQVAVTAVAPAPAQVPSPWPTGAVPGTPPLPAPPEAMMSADTGPSSEELLDKIKSKQDREEAEAEEEDEELALQVKLHNRMERAALISNMMNMEHETSMAIIRNIK